MPKISWNSYKDVNAFDEYVSSENKLRVETKKISDFIGRYSTKRLQTTVKNSENAISQRGITFRVYSEDKPADHYWPLDIIPRIITKKNWTKISKSLIQRVKGAQSFYQRCL
jgi:uncharacterized circularly permuted ATP-grasp superfamily protein